MSVLGKPRIPASTEQVDLEWVRSALRTRWPELDVSAIGVDAVVHGAATKLKLRLSLNAPTPGLSPEIWVKGGWEAHSEWLGSVARVYAREAWFYRDLNPLLKLNTPRAYYADFTADWQAVVILEDLIARGARLTRCTESASEGAMRRSLEELARLHARFWDQEIVDFPLDLPMRQDDASSDWPRRNGPHVIAKYLSGARGATVPAALRDPERIDRAFWVHLKHLGHDRPYCILHGDTHPGNGFIDSNGAPGFFDWQTIAKGPWAYDVAYHIVSSLSVEDRRRYESDLLRHYLGALAISGVTKPPGFDHAWLQYRRYIAYGLHIWITNPAEFQPEENCLAMTQRFTHAAADLDFFAAWGV